MSNLADKTNSNTSDRHAYLVMAHHKPDLLRELLSALDDERNDIYLHIDKKAEDDMDPTGFYVGKSGLFFIDRMNVNWAGYTQIECTLNLLEEAVKRGGYDRYHLITGSSYPLRSQDYIHEFFLNHPTAEFIDIDTSDVYTDRVKYKFLFNESYRNTTIKKIPLDFIRLLYLKIQQVLGVDRFRRFNMVAKKGLAYWSITETLAQHTVKNRGLIKDMMRYSKCGDEMFMQIIAYNSVYKGNLFTPDGTANGCLRLTTWPLESNGIIRKNHNFTMEDKELILSDTKNIFALKFEGVDGPKLIEEINKRESQRRNI